MLAQNLFTNRSQLMYNVQVPINITCLKQHVRFNSYTRVHPTTTKRHKETTTHNNILWKVYIVATGLILPYLSRRTSVLPHIALNPSVAGIIHSYYHVALSALLFVPQETAWKA